MTEPTTPPPDDPFVAMCTGLYDAWAGGDQEAAGAPVAVSEPDCIYDAVDVIAEQEGSALAAVGIEIVPADEADEEFLARFEAAR